MSGSILIRDKGSISLGSSIFDYLIEKIRASFHKDEEKYKNEIYRPFDEGGMPFISVKDQNIEGFFAFCRATERAYGEASKERSFPTYETVWRNLLDLLKSDSRYRESM
jgi:hypothetical protein